MNDFPSSMRHLMKLAEKMGKIGLHNHSWDMLKQMKDLMDDDFWSELEKLQQLGVHGADRDSHDKDDTVIQKNKSGNKKRSSNVYNLKYAADTRSKEYVNPPVDVYQTIGKVIVCCALPGLDKNSLKISLTEGRLLMLEGKIRQHDFGRNPEFVVQQERQHGKFLRRIELPCRVKSDDVSKSYKNGILEMVFSRVIGDESEYLEVDW
ncbi:MAG: Hsp20/alpha crystallin family protein [Bacillaceae bacterium]|nr:Hsp20/alpha crystallin family protein [Bacillaceae bacterium]